MEHSVEMQSGPGKAGAQPTKDQTETEVRVPAKIDLKSVLAGFSSAKSKAAPLSATTARKDVKSSPDLTATSASAKSQPTTPTTPTTTYLSTKTTTTLSSSSSSSTTTATTATAAATTVSSLTASNDAEDKKEGQNAEGEPKTEGEEEPFVMTPAYERLARLLARKRENAAAATDTSAIASGSGEGTGVVDSETLPQQSHWSKLRTTVQIASVVKQRSKRRYNHHRQDSFLRKFSTRHNSNLDADSDSEDNEAVTQEIEKEVEHKRLCRYVIRPEGTLMMYWLLILTLAVLYNLWTCIAREAFQEIQLEYASFWISFDVICDLIYLADIAVQFRTGYLEQGLLVYNSKKLSNNYMTSSDFKLDVSCLLPLDLIQLTIGWHPILRFPRFLKIYRTFRCVHMLESRTPYPNLFRVANLTHILFLGAHWFAAFFYLISEAENFVGKWTYPKPVGEFAGVTRKYLYSLFWSTLTLTTIGDLPQPTTNWEFVFVIFSYLIGVFIFATIVGQVGNVITNRNASRQEFERLLDGAKFYMQSHNVPKELQKRVQRWYDYVWSRGRLNGSLDIGSLGMLPDKLKTELALNVNLDTLKKVTIFQECQPEFLHDLVLKMKAHIFTPGDLICRRGEVAREMFIIADGVVEIISDRGTVLTSMSSGDFFGEIGILNLHGGINRRTADVRSLGYSELFVLSREDVLAALKDQPDAEAILVRYAQERLRDLREYRASTSVSPVVSSNKGRWTRILNEARQHQQHQLQTSPKQASHKSITESIHKTLLTTNPRYLSSLDVGLNDVSIDDGLGHLSFVRRSRVLLEDVRPPIGYSFHPGHNNCFQHLNVGRSIDSKTSGKKWGGLTCPSLLTTPKTISNHGNLHIIREYGEKRLKEIEAHNKKNSDTTPTPSPRPAQKNSNKPTAAQNSLQVGPVKKNKPLRMSNLDKPSSQGKESLKSKTYSISKRLRELPLGRSIIMATSSGASASGSSGNESRLHRLWRNNWSKMFSARKSAVDEESRNVQGTGARSEEKRRKSSSNSSSSPEAPTCKQGVTFSEDGDGSKGEVGSGGITGDVQSISGKGTVHANRKTLSNRFSSIMSQRKVSHGAKYSAVKPDTSDSDSTYTDSASQPLTKPPETAKKDCPVADRRVGGFAGLLSAAGFRRTSPAKTSESTIRSAPPVPHISWTVSSPPSSKQPVSQELGQSSNIPAGDVVVDTGDLAAVGQSTTKPPSLSTTILIENVNDDRSTSEITNTCWPQQQQQQAQFGTYTTTTTTNSTALTNAKSPVAGSVSSLPSSISAIRGHLTSLPASSSVHAFSSSFGPASRGSSSLFPNPARSATTQSFTSSSFYPGTGSGTVTNRPPITQSYSFSSSSSPSFYPGGVSNTSTSSSSTPNVTTSTTAKTTSTTTTTKTTPTTTTTGLISAPISGNKFSLLAGRRRGAQQASGLRSCSLEEYRTSTSSSDFQTSSHLVTSSSSFWSPTPAAPPPSYYSSYSVSSSFMHPQVNRWIPGSGSTHASPLGLTTRSSASTTTSIENGALLGQTASSPIDANGKGRTEPISSDKHWQANQVIIDIQRILDEKINELQRVYQDSIEQYAQRVRHQEDRIQELEYQLKNLQAENTLTDILPLNVGAFVYPAWARNSPARLWRTQ